VRWSATPVFTTGQEEKADPESAELHEIVYEMGNKLCGRGEEVGRHYIGSGELGPYAVGPLNGNDHPSYTLA
jgi:hypothetical protein